MSIVEKVAESGGKALTIELKKALRDLITSSLNKRFISISSLDDIPTGNKYQSVQLGDELASGFRGDRSGLFSRLDFTGRSVLDCGCNLGEMSRLARKRGARLVDGLEYEGYFVAIGRLINAYNDVTRVSLFQRDLTDPESFAEQYDIALVFSVLPYVLPVLDRLCSKITEAIIVETHDVKASLHKTYVEPFTKHFPHYTFVDVTDHGHGLGRRAVLMFTRRREALYYSHGLLKSSIDVTASKFDYLTAFASRSNGVQLAPAATPQELLAQAAKLEAPDDSDKLTSGASYWASMIRGYAEYRSAGTVAEDNAYLHAFRTTLRSDQLDPKLTARLQSDRQIVERVVNRFRDVDALAKGQDAALSIHPVRVINPLDEEGKNLVVHAESGRQMRNTHIDGYDRVFWARLFGITRLPAIFHIE
jgi:hypothetical protein